MRSDMVSEKEANLLMDIVYEAVQGCALSLEEVNDFLTDSVRKQAFMLSIKGLICSYVSYSFDNPYIFEKIEHSHSVVGGWKLPSLSEMMNKAEAIFPSLTVDLSGNCKAVPFYADGLALIPKLSSLGRMYGVKEPYGSGYGALVRVLIKELNLKNKLQGKLGINHIRLELKSRKRLEQIEREAPGDYLVLPVNFGTLYAGYSARNALYTAMQDNRLLLGSAQLLSVLGIALSEANQLQSQALFCAGDQYSWDELLGVKEEWLECPLIDLHSREYCSDWCFLPRIDAGPVSIFLE